MNRRGFTRLTALAALMAAFPGVAVATSRPPRWDRVLVLVELNGGNDGLNTLVPYADPQYYRLRPRLALARDSVLQLSEKLGFNPALEALMPAWNARELAVVLGVGYPNPNRSHFRSIAIWETGSDSHEVLQEGWIARAFAQDPASANFTADGVVIGHGESPLYGRRMRNIVMRDARHFMRQVRSIERLTATTDNTVLSHLLSAQTDLYTAAQALARKLAQAPRLTTPFPRTRIARQLETAAGLVAAGVSTPVIKVSHGSFDTHAQQRGRQDRLLAELAEALSAFRAAMQEAGTWDRVLILSYSEFGRRAGENSSRGTDHGTAAPHLLLGGRVIGGLYGQQPSLTHLVNADLGYHVDYRSLYATVARGWWGMRDPPFTTATCRSSVWLDSACRAKFT
jgi:uncharacterized protein (DUF1501 family)